MAIKKITDLQRNILDCLTKGMTTEETAAECNCSISSVKHTRANRELQDYYKESCFNNIKLLIPAAIKELHRLVIDPTVQDSVKVSAVKQILEISRVSDVAGAAQQDINITVSYE